MGRQGRAPGMEPSNPKAREFPTRNSLRTPLIRKTTGAMKTVNVSFLSLMTLFLASGQASGDVHEKFKLVPNDGAPEDRFGSSVAISGDIAIVGSPGDDDLGDGSGSAYVFNTTNGNQAFKLLPSHGRIGDGFGYSVAISGNFAVIGSPFADLSGDNAGSAYVFNAANGVQMFKLLPSDGQAGDWFGVSVGISGTKAIIGARNDNDNGSLAGSAYVFDLITGSFSFKLLASDGDSGDHFGDSVAIDGITAVVGAFADEDNGPTSGSAYLFDVTNGMQISKLLPDDGEQGDSFGWSVAISDSFGALVGSVFDDDSANNAGAAYLFGAGSVQAAKLLASDGGGIDYFGYSSDMDGTTAIVGAKKGGGPVIGSAYLYDAAAGVELFQLKQSDGATGDEFGRAVGISGDLAIVGAREDDDNGFDSGSAYLFQVFSSGSAFCHGSEGSTVSNCPCAASLGLTGCVNSTGKGASLSASGNALVASDSLVLSVSDSVPGGFGLLFQGTTAIAEGAGVPLGNGLLCINTQRRWTPKSANAFGGVSYGPGLLGTDPAAVPGATLFYQWWFRDVLAPCGGGFNFSTAWCETWQ